LVERIPTIEEYERLCSEVGWANVMDFSAAV
jgi:hypothetical protein